MFLGVHYYVGVLAKLGIWTKSKNFDDAQKEANLAGGKIG
jgi:hypothetical protein